MLCLNEAHPNMRFGPKPKHDTVQAFSDQRFIGWLPEWLRGSTTQLAKDPDFIKQLYDYDLGFDFTKFQPKAQNPMGQNLVSPFPSSQINTPSDMVMVENLWRSKSEAG